MHPSLEELIEFVQGRMDPSIQAEVESHVEACDTCCQLLRNAPNDTLLEQLIKRPTVETLATRPPAKPAGPPTPCQTAAELLAEIRQSGILSSEQWAVAEAAARETPAAIRLAERLVAEELLTPWQSDRLLARQGGSLTLGKYQLLSLLGSGGMAKVYLAKQTLLDRRVAIKLLPKQKIVNGSYLERFHREAQLVAALDHKNIVRAYHADNVGQQHYLVMEYIVGDTLQDLVDRDGPFDCQLAAECVAQAAEGLAHAAEAGIVHRDIKPANLLVDAEGTVKILDMGLGRLGEESEHSITQKYDDRLIGTTDYMAPEQALDAHAVDSRADIYSLGATLYFLLTGQPPFPEGTVAERLMKHQREEPQAIRALRPDCPPGLATICQRMMAKRPEQRYQTAETAAEALRTWLANPQLIEVAPAPVASDEVDEAAPQRAASAWLAALAGGLLAATVVGGAFLGYRHWQSPAVEPEPTPVVVTPPAKPQPDPAIKAAKTLLAERGLEFDNTRWVLKIEKQARTLLAKLENGDTEVARCQTELVDFQKKYRETIDQAAGKSAEAQKAVWLLPQHHHTFEMALHQARMGLIQGIQQGQTLAGELAGAQQAVAHDSQVTSALDTLAAHGQPAALTTAEELAQLAAALRAFGGRLIHEETPLSRRGSVLTLEVEAGGEKLLLDVHPAASNNLLSDEQARRLGIAIPAAAPRVSLAVGRDEKGAPKHVPASEVVLDRVTAGPLTNANVRFLVIPPEYPKIRPALSAAFWYGRQCEFDAKAGVLRIVRLREAEAP